MKTSQLVRELAEVIEKYGDLPATYFDGACSHEPEVIVGEHRTGNTVMIWEHIPPATDSEIVAILAGANPADIASAHEHGSKSPRDVAAFLVLAGKRPNPWREHSPAHPKESELSRQEQPTKENIALADPSPIKTDAQDKRCESLLITLRDILDETANLDYKAERSSDFGLSDYRDAVLRIQRLATDVLAKAEGKPSA